MIWKVGGIPQRVCSEFWVLTICTNEKFQLPSFMAPEMKFEQLTTVIQSSKYKLNVCRNLVRRVFQYIISCLVLLIALFIWF